MENAKKHDDLKIFNLIQEVGVNLFCDYPDYDKYKKDLKKDLLNIEKWEHLLLDKTKSEEDIESTRSLIVSIKNGRENFKKLFGVYEISESDYYSSPSSIDCTDEKLIHDFGVLPEIEEDVDYSKIKYETK